MDARPSDHEKDQKQTENSLAEVPSTEKLLWASVNLKGLLHPDVKHLYHQVCSVYEKSILKDSEQADLQEIEYSLWKLHYKHIDEFRNQIKKVSSCMNSEVSQNVTNAQRSTDDYTEGIKLFLSEATNFYNSLIVKVQRCHGIPEDTLFHRNSGMVNDVDQKRIKKWQFLCHRFLICLGDLARYKELYERPDNQNRNWSFAAAHYLEASTIWPDSGNPHNQLALLSTYVGDEFLALYHCIRSLAIKEPFPDAWNNLILLLEKSRSSLLHSHSAEASVDFSILSERRKILTKLQSGDLVMNCYLSTDERGCLGRNLWHLFVIMISFFYVRSSLDDFLRAFSSTKGELEALFDLDDINLEDALKSYQFMDPTRTGPFRAVQAICVFIFVIQNLPKNPVMTNFEDKKETPPLLSRDHVVMALFTYVNQLVDRVVKASPWDSCPLLPAILVFVEWLANLPEEEHLCGADEKSEAALSSFFKSFIRLVNLMHSHVGGVKSQDFALWEDYELRGFAPAARTHVMLDFSSHWENSTDYRSGKVCRAHRIIVAAVRIAESSGRHHRWIQYDKLRRQFYELESNGSTEIKCSEKDKSTMGTNPELKISPPQTSEVTEERGKEVLRESPRRSFALEEEEVILFKPLTRHNSAPLHGYITKKGDSHEELMDQSASPDECLRRATSLLIAQNPVHSEPSNFQPNNNSFRHNEPFKQQHLPPPIFGDMANLFPGTPISSGPPSLNAWVLNRGSLNVDKEKGIDLGKRHLPPIEETASESLADLSINKATEPQNPVVSSCYESVITHYPSPPYSTPVPSAPLLPDNAVWFSGVNTSSFSDHKTNETIGVTENFLNASPGKSYPDYAVPLAPNASSIGVAGFNYVYPIQCGMSSSEWLRQFREINNLHQGNNGQLLSPSFYGPGNIGNVYHLGVPQINPINSWVTPSFSNQTAYSNHQAATPGFPAFYGVDEPKDRVYHAYYRASPYGCGAVTAEPRDDQQVLLQYLKEREWRLQQDPNLRGPTF
ncbi:hypothetical protein NL676_008128 [Syzygium grande]|nr:hypothetical protein NL676_008128 [Syzygium grande]